ncbi:MAG: type I restriction endonuclease [Bacillota bacterium]|nr:type I restriction endonuclease [Bacillota bacterium]
MPVITPDILKEKSFQGLIKGYLIEENKYVESFNKGYDRNYAIDIDMLFSFLENTQKKKIDKLKEIYGSEYKEKILYNIDKELKRRGSVDVIKHGIKDFGKKLQLAYFKPPTNLNPDQYLLYQKNILSVTEELVYDINKEDRIDLVIFLNGIPIITMELKNSFTGQTYRDAIKQYKNDRSNKEQLFKFKERAIVNFAIDTDQVYMATRLKGKNTSFLPFNKGNNGGAGNPQVEGKLRTHYLWEEILKKDNILEILDKFTYIEEKEEELADGETIKKETLIFPRYHQLDAVRKILSHVKENGAGHKYLVQHSAGSGKTNSITWLSHRLVSLHNAGNDVIFDGVIVVTDRKVLDQQLQDSIYSLEHKIGLVAKIEQDSTQLATELEKGTKIIISTIQKFPYILDMISGTKDKSYAIVIDEAHSSTSGDNIKALRASLSQEEALEIASKEEKEEKDTEDKINEEIEKVSGSKNLSFFAFTATPKGTTLRIFGTPKKDESGKEDRYYPFHIYSMKQAIEEGFILDVLQNYMTYKMYYNVNKKVQDDPSFDKSKATKSIVKYVSIHPHNIAQKTEVIVEHFVNHTMKKIGGEAKAMLVTPSRLHAVRYKLAFDRYIKEKGYSKLNTFVAFSGSLKENGTEYKETSMNDGISQNQLPAEFDKDESRVLIVANKYQTGFDQPRLHTMYVDKKLSGVKAVQTLSRLNRIYPGKEDTFILDFVNEPEEIKESFMPFYRVSKLDNDIDPNEINAVQRSIMDKKVIDMEDVEKFADYFYMDKRENKHISIMNNLVDTAADRIDKFTREEKLEFRSLVNKFINLYNLIIQIVPLKDSEFHRLSIYLRYLRQKIDIENPRGIDITDKVVLEYYKLEEKSKGQIYLEDGKDKSLYVNVSGGGVVSEPEKDTLSSIIKKLNDMHGTNFSKSERLAVEQIRESLITDKDLELKAKNNTYDDFKYAFEPSFDDRIIEEFDKNKDFYGKILKDEDFKKNLMNLIMLDIYASLKEVEKG